MATSPESTQTSPLLDSHCESRTSGTGRGREGDSSAKAADSGSEHPTVKLHTARDHESGSDVDTEGWSRQQKRTYHRVLTLLSYWEQHEYEIRWVTLTSSEDSDPAEELAYNHRKLRQTLERARLAYDEDGNAHDLSHIRDLESLVIRTSEGPEGKGVLHLFWAWDPPKGQHSREFYVPHKWLCEQWGRIHGPERRTGDIDITEPASAPGEDPSDEWSWDGRLHTWIEEVGSEDYHSRENLAGYAVTQYLGEHGEALENISWSWERSLGGSITETWEALKSVAESLDDAKEAWHDVLGGERMELTHDGRYATWTHVVKPPPNLGVERGEIQPDVGEIEQWGSSHNEVVHTLPSYDEAYGLCPECREYHVMERVGELMVCGSCGARRAVTDEPVVTEFDPDQYRTPVVEKTEYRQTELTEFGVWCPPVELGDEPVEGPGGDGVGASSSIIDLERSRAKTFDPAGDDESSTDVLVDESVCRYVEQNPEASVPEVMGHFLLPPEAEPAVEELVARPPGGEEGHG